jgi:hypothetical protein
MTEIETCKECGVPLMVSQGMKWDSNGVIPLSFNPRRRSVFYESDVVDTLIKGIGDIIGMPVDHIVIESRRRDVRRFIERTFPSQIEESLEYQRDLESETDPAQKQAKRKRLFEMRKGYQLQVDEIGRVYGYGNIQVSDRWEKGEDFAWRTLVISNPHSMLFYPAEMLGSVEGFEQINMRVEYELIEDNTYAVSVYPGSHPLELKERLRRKRYDFKPGDIEFECCSTCGVPLEISRCKWDLEAGTIIDSLTGRRMAIYGPEAMEAVLDDLEAELGEVIPDTVIEAQRRFFKSEMGGDNWMRAAADFKHLLGLRGLGHLARFETSPQGLTVTIENSCMHLLMVGSILAIFDLAMGTEDFSYEWDLAENGDLTVTIKVLRDESE